jgi:hypothetical protein
MGAAEHPVFPAPSSLSGKVTNANDSGIPVARPRRHVGTPEARSIERLVVVGGRRRWQRADIAAAKVIFSRRLLAPQGGFPGANHDAVEEIVHNKNRSLGH